MRHPRVVQSQDLAFRNGESLRFSVPPGRWNGPRALQGPTRRRYGCAVRHDRSALKRAYDSVFKDRGSRLAPKSGGRDSRRRVRLRQAPGRLFRSYAPSFRAHPQLVPTGGLPRARRFFMARHGRAFGRDRSGAGVVHNFSAGKIAELLHLSGSVEHHFPGVGGAQ